MQAYARTDVGRLRNTNQDYIYSSTKPVGPLNNLFVVADGMGGHQAGDYASKSVVEGLVTYISEAPKTMSTIQALEQGIKQAGKAVYDAAQSDSSLAGMGTTLVAATIDDTTLYVANIGDSRLYLIRDKILQVTKDHSYVEELVLLGQMERGSQDYQNKKNIITRAVGITPEVDIDFFELPLQSKDCLLICSDGLTTMVDDQNLEHIISTSESLRDRTKLLIDQANLNGGKDNIAVVLIEPQISGVGVC